MPDGVNDDLALTDLVKDQVGIGRRRHSTDRRIIRAAANVGMQKQEVGNGLDARLYPPRACGERAAI
jgi:hypothetical protein